MNLGSPTLETMHHKTVETYKATSIVCPQEMSWHGVKMQGPCARLVTAGCEGKWASNIQRDMLRTSSTGDDATWLWYSS